MKKRNTTLKLEVLTVDNASKAATVVSLSGRFEGSKQFSHNAQELNDNRYASIVGTGSNGFVVFEDDYKYYAIASYKG
jgi:hypothetical protein